MELQDYMVPSFKASWGSKTASARKQRGAPGSYNLPFFENLEGGNELHIKD